MADEYPFQFRTERDFFPLVRAFLEGRVPTVTAEVGESSKKIDFRIGGPNPALLELAVRPRAFADPNHDGVRFPGNNQAPQLFASTNKTELSKLGSVSQNKAKNRFLLLLDFRGGHDVARLKRSYLKALPQDGKHAAVRVVYISRDQEVHFQAGGRKTGAPKTTSSKKTRSNATTAEKRATTNASSQKTAPNVLTPEKRGPTSAASPEPRRKRPSR